MTYDFFGTPWATELAHHTNLYPNGSANNWSVETAVNYLESIGVPLKQVFIGYAGYSRNAHDATIQSVSPLKGTYTPDTARRSEHLNPAQRNGTTISQIILIWKTRPVAIILLFTPMKWRMRISCITHSLKSLCRWIPHAP